MLPISRVKRASIATLLCERCRSLCVCFEDLWGQLHRIGPHQMASYSPFFLQTTVQFLETLQTSYPQRANLRVMIKQDTIGVKILKTLLSLLESRINHNFQIFHVVSSS